MVIERHLWLEGRWVLLKAYILVWIYIYLVFEIELALSLFDVLIFLSVKWYVFSCVLIEILGYFLIFIHFRGLNLRNHTGKIQISSSIFNPRGVWDLAQCRYPSLVIPFHGLPLLSRLVWKCCGWHLFIRFPYIWGEHGVDVAFCFWFH